MCVASLGVVHAEEVRGGGIECCSRGLELRRAPVRALRLRQADVIFVFFSPPMQIMVKGKGIFVNPASAAAPAKLRVLYEVGPIAYLIEKAGGKSSDGENSALDIKIPHTEVRRRVVYVDMRNAYTDFDIQAQLLVVYPYRISLQKIAST